MLKDLFYLGQLVVPHSKTIDSPFDMWLGFDNQATRYYKSTGFLTVLEKSEDYLLAGAPGQTTYRAAFRYSDLSIKTSFHKV